jgi:hypothetical protein
MNEPDLAIHVSMLRQLTADAMSSDESEDEEGRQRVYNTRKKNWRSLKMQQFLRDLDALDRYQRSLVSSSGNWPRKRNFACGKVSKRRPVRGLPINFYDEDWLANLTDEGREELDINLSRYDLCITEKVARLVVKGSNTVEV